MWQQNSWYFSTVFMWVATLWWDTKVQLFQKHYCGAVQLRPRTRLCKFFEQGTCTKGASCTFAHGLHELQASERFSSVSGGVCFKKWISKHIDLAAYEMRPGVRTMACKKALFLALRERLLAEGLIEMKTERTPTEGQLSILVVSSLWLAGSEQSAW